MKEIERLEKLTGKKVQLKESIMTGDTVTFTVTPKNANWTIYGLDKVMPQLESDEFDVEDIWGTIYWRLQFDFKTAGINGFDQTFTLKEVRFTIKTWDGVSSDEQVLDTSEYEFDADIKFDDNGVLQIQYVEIDAVNKKIELM